MNQSYDVPYNKEAEAAVLISAQFSPDAVSEYIGVLRPDDFYWKPFGWMWSAILAVAERGDPLDFVTVEDEMKRSGNLEEFCIDADGVRGRAAVIVMLTNPPLRGTLGQYVNQVLDYSNRRKILETMKRGAAWALNGKTSAEILAGLEKDLSKIAVASGADTTGNLLSAADAVMVASRNTEAAVKGESLAVPSGLVDLDGLLAGGFYPGDLVLCAARPGQGKTALLCTLAVNAAIKYAAGRRKRVLFFSLEMPSDQIVNRMLSQLSGIPTTSMRSGRIENWEAYYSAVEHFAAAPILFDDSPGLTIGLMRQKLKKAVERGVDLVLLDQVNMMQDIAGNGAKEHERINKITYGLKTLAREFNLPIVAAHQLSRSIETRADDEPVLADLEQAGEKPSDVVLFIHHKVTGGQIERSFVKVGKQRNGPVGRVQVVYMPERTRFENSLRS